MASPQHPNAYSSPNPYDVRAEHPYAVSLNEGVLELFRKTLEENPLVDLEPVLFQTLATYNTRRVKAEAKDEAERHGDVMEATSIRRASVRRAKERDATGRSRSQSSAVPSSAVPSETPILSSKAASQSQPSVLRPDAPLLTSKASVNAIPRELKRVLYVPDNHAIEILRPLDPVLSKMLGSPPTHSALRTLLNNFISHISSESGIHVLKLTDTLVVKIRLHLPSAPFIPPENEQDALSTVSSQVHGFAVAKPLGLLKADNLHYSFMTNLPGIPAEFVWSEFYPEQKESLKTDLARYFSMLRKATNETGKFGLNDVVVDSRHGGLRVTSKPIGTFEEFLSFLQDGADEHQSFQSLDTLLDDSTLEELSEGPLAPEHNGVETLVFTHGNIQPRNLLLTEDGGLSGVVNWDAAGWYPRFWEGIRAVDPPGSTKGGVVLDRDWLKMVPDGMYA